MMGNLSMDNLREAVQANISETLRQINENKLKDLQEELRNLKTLEKSNYHPQCMCMMGSLEPKHKTDCYFYEEVVDMGGHIPTCGYYAELGYCPCEKCSKYISNKDVSSKVREFVDKRKVE